MACKLTTRMREHRRSAIMSGHSVDTSTRERMLRRDKDWIAQCDRVRVYDRRETVGSAMASPKKSPEHSQF